jgi:Rieske Fe-S protein
MMITDLIQGRENPWARLYDPSRKSLRTTHHFGRENLNVAAQFADWLTPGDIKSTRGLHRGHGAVLRDGLRKIAAFRDQDGTLYQHSATCTHLGCAVAWNAAEQTFDCPCHGSRFDKYDGHPLNGPAVQALGPVEEPRAPRKPADHPRRPARHQ